MEDNVAFLTEQKLGVILKEIFPDFDVLPQYKFYRRKIDYCLKISDINNLDVKNIKLPTPIKDRIWQLIEKNKDNVHIQPLDFIENLRIFVEYDGNYHYMNNSNVVKNNSCFEWNEIELLTFEVRIPYWVQLDLEVTKMIFEYEKDFSNNFPHGFISKKCVLPENFCVAGEDRLIKEIKLLPSRIQKDVIVSLIEKSKDSLGDFSYNKFIRTGSLRLWEELSKIHPIAKDHLYRFK
jgi:hypothetical protein